MSELRCEKCERELVIIPCPENRPGCCVLHYKKCECEKEFNLSDREILAQGPIEFDNPVYWKKDVKEFIKRLKIEMFENFKEGNKPKDPLDIIDKLAGDDLK